MKSNYFRVINKSNSLKMNMLSVACAAGITMALGTPLGGVLFSIESTSSLYLTSNIWKAFFSSMVCVLVTRIFKKTPVIIPISVEELEKTTTPRFLLINFIIVGLLSGAIGASASTLISKGTYIRKKTKIKALNNRFIFASIVAVITSVVGFFFTSMQKSDRTIMNFCFSLNENYMPYIIHPGEGYHLLMAFILKYILTISGLICTMPAGVVGPLFAIGALFGRLYGHIIFKIYGINIESAFAMAGSAGAFSGFSHTVSSALIIFEITGQARFCSLLLISAVISNLVGKSLSMGIFDVLLAIKNIPHLPALKSSESYNLKAGDIMEDIDYALKMDNLKIITGFESLNKIPKKKEITIPIIDSNRIIKYTVTPKNLLDYIISVYDTCKREFDAKTRTNINEFILINKSKFSGEKKPWLRRYQKKFQKILIGSKGQQILLLNKTFKEESCLRIMTILKKNAPKDKKFLSKKIEINSKILNSDPSALTIDKTFPFVKIQFLFTFLNVSHIFVTDNGKLCGVITKANFVKK